MQAPTFCSTRFCRNGERPQVARYSPLLRAVLLASWTGVASAHMSPGPTNASSAAAHGLNFSYDILGARALAPTQIFDDGRRTYLQFNTLAEPPEAWLDMEDSRRPATRLTMRLEAPYLVIDRVVPRLRLAWEGAETRISNMHWHTHGVRGARLPRPHSDPGLPTFGPAQVPSASLSDLASLVPPVHAVVAAAQGSPGMPPVAPETPVMRLALAETRARTDVPLRDEAPRDLAIVPAVPAATGLNRPTDALALEVRDNQRLSMALADFLQAQGWRLEWESPSDFVIRRGYVVRGENLRAVLMDTLSEYRLSAVLYGGNRVVAVSGGDH